MKRRIPQLLELASPAGGGRTQAKSVRTFGAARDFLSDGDLVAITLVGHYMMTARFVGTFEIDLDDAPGEWDAIDH